MNLNLGTELRQLNDDEVLAVSGGKGKTREKICVTVVYEDTKTGKFSNERTCTPIK